MSFSRVSRWTHRWGSIVILIPTAVIFASGIVLQLKKEYAWIQPATKTGEGTGASLSFDQILEVARGIPAADVNSWADIDRLDVRPGKGMLKVRCKNRQEIQIDANSGAVLQVTYRRSDLIESIHDGSFFHDSVKLWIFLPTALILMVLWITGAYLFALPYLARWKRTRQKRANELPKKSESLQQN